MSEDCDIDFCFSARATAGLAERARSLRASLFRRRASNLAREHAVTRTHHTKGSPALRSSKLLLECIVAGCHAERAQIVTRSPLMRVASMALRKRDKLTPHCNGHC